jgi:hypothetical protein
MTSEAMLRDLMHSAHQLNDTMQRGAAALERLAAVFDQAPPDTPPVTPDVARVVQADD